MVVAAPELRVGALLEADASRGAERDALRQRDIGVLELCLPDRVVGVLRVLERYVHASRRTCLGGVGRGGDVEVERNVVAVRRREGRSEEHTSELQSPCN